MNIQHLNLSIYNQILHLDSIIMSTLSGCMIVGFFYWVSTKSRWYQCDMMQNFCELFVETVADNVNSIYGSCNVFLISSSCVLFSWTLLMNLTDLLPKSIGIFLLRTCGIKSGFEIVPTEDPSIVCALAFCVFGIVTWHSAEKYGGVYGYFDHIISEPFGYIGMPVNIFFNLLEILIRPVTMALRLFGNMLVGGIVGEITATFHPICIILCTVLWSLIHLTVLFVQAFIITALHLIYIGKGPYDSDTKYTYNLPEIDNDKTEN